MSKPVTPERKKEVIEAVENGMPTGEAARRFGVKKATIENWLKKGGDSQEQDSLVQPVEKAEVPARRKEPCPNPSCEKGELKDGACSQCGFDKKRWK